MAQCALLDTSLDSYRSKWTSFASAIDDILNALLPINPSVMWPVISGNGIYIGSVGAADFAFKLSNISWTLTDSSYGALNGGVGEVLSTFKGGDWQDPSDWQNAAEMINASDFAKYLNLNGGMHYLILHETAHTTELGIRTNNMQFDKYLHDGGDRSDGEAWSKSPEWLYNEQVANAIARTVAQQLNLHILDQPTCGYPGDSTSRPPLRQVVMA